MAKPLRKVSISDLGLISDALRAMKDVHFFLERAGAEQAAKSVRACAKSIQGAYRHAQRCYEKQQREG